MRRLILAALVAALMAPAVAQAQQHQHGQPQGQGQKQQMGQHQMGGMQGGMQMGGGLPGPLRGLVPFAPDNVLKMKEMLELSADQEKQLTALSAWAKQAGDEAHAPVRTQLGHELEYMPYGLASRLNCQVWVPDGRGQGEMGETNP